MGLLNIALFVSFVQLNYLSFNAYDITRKRQVLLTKGALDSILTGSGAVDVKEEKE